MKNSTIFFLFVLSIWADCFSQILPGAKEIAMSNSTIADCENVFAIFYNPAGLTNINMREAGLYISPSPYGLKELRNTYTAYNEPFENFSIALGYKSYGFELYRENEIIVGLSKELFTNYNFGIAISKYQLSIKKYGQSNFYSCIIGNNFEIDSTLIFAVAVRNLYLAEYDDALIKNLQLETGIAFKKSNFILTASLLKEMNFEPSYSFGLDYQIIRYINLRAGFRNYPQTFSYGIGINYAFMNFDSRGLLTCNLA